MKKMALVMVVAMLGACGGEEDTTDTQEKCTSAGDQRCTGTKLEECSGGVWALEKDCGSTNQICVEQASFAAASCKAPVGAAGECNDDSECAAGLSCLAVDWISTSDTRCLATCDATAGTCDNGLCAAVDAQATGAEGACFPNSAERDGECITNYESCANADECSPRSSDAEGNPSELRCTTVCEAIGTATGCTGGDQCLNSGWVSPDPDGTTCTSAQVNTQGSCPAGYECTKLSSTQYGCYAPIGWCGTVTPLTTALDDAALNTAIEDGNLCNDVDDHRMCSITGSDAAVDDAVAYCIGIDQNSNEGICIAFCDGEVNQELDCGTGLSCQPPPVGGRYFYTEEMSGASAKTCVAEGDDTGCNTAEGNKCWADLIGYEGQKICAFLYQICAP